MLARQGNTEKKMSIIATTDKMEVAKYKIFTQ